MYESFYRLSGKPFQLSPDPEFFFGSRGHRRAMAYLEYGLHQAEGFIVVTGEVGAGKTTLVQQLLRRLPANNVVPVQIVTTQLEAEDLVRIVASSFGLPTDDTNDKSTLLIRLEAYLRELQGQGKRALLIVDEAQNLGARAIEELRMLSNFQLGTKATLQSFLLGQPELRDLMQRPEMRQLKQRIIAAYHRARSIGPRRSSTSSTASRTWDGREILPSTRPPSIASSRSRTAFRAGSTRSSIDCCSRAISARSTPSSKATSSTSRAS